MKRNGEGREIRNVKCKGGRRKEAKVAERILLRFGEHEGARRAFPNEESQA